MDLKRIKEALQAYESLVDDRDRDRLAFFLRIWTAQATCAEEFKHDFIPYDIPDHKLLVQCYSANRPVFSAYPCPIAGEPLEKTAASIARAFCDGEEYPSSVRESLSALDWHHLFTTCDNRIAGQDPSSWLTDIENALITADEKFDSHTDTENSDTREKALTLVEGNADKVTGSNQNSEENSKHSMTDQDAIIRLGTLIASLALKIQLEEPAALTMKAFGQGADTPHSTLCPICGFPPMLAHVGGPTSSEGRGRLLVCPQCGATWEFERIRCARCGSRHESALHYYHIDSDDTHRIAICDECKGYIRTLFSEHEPLPLSYEVEDVLMARLDAIAPQVLAMPSSSW